MEITLQESMPHDLCICGMEMLIAVTGMIAQGYCRNVLMRFIQWSENLCRNPESSIFAHMDGPDPYIDIHTHRTDPYAGEIVVRSMFVQDAKIPADTNRLFTAGLHPWHAAQIDLDASLHSLRELAIQGNFRAIGEIGIDRACGVDITRQREVFTAQCALARDLHVPIVVHVVRAQSDILEVKKRFGFPPIWIMHGFRGKVEAVRQLLHHGAYISFGEALLSATPSLREAYLTVPVEKLFLETDASPKAIADIYAEAAALRGVPVEELRKQLNRNYVRCFEKGEG